MSDLSSTEVVEKESPKKGWIPHFALVPLIYAHYWATQDGEQHADWKQRIDKAAHCDALVSTTDPDEKRILSNPLAWRSIQSTSWWATMLSLLASSYGTYTIVENYAIGLGYGPAVASAFLLPIPVAWAVGRSLYKKTKLRVMAHLGNKPTPKDHFTSWFVAAAGSFGAGAGFGFTLTFLQGLISWFTTPASSVGMEIFIDATAGLNAALTAGMVSAMFLPLMCGKAPARNMLGEFKGAPQLPEATKEEEDSEESPCTV